MTEAVERSTRPTFRKAWRPLDVIVAAISSTAAIPPISEQTRAALDRAIGAKGVYVSEESAYRFTFPRSDLSLRVAGQRLSPAQTPTSWATFSPAVHHEAVLVAELVLLEDEVNPVITVALISGLQVTGLGPTLSLEVPRLLALNLSGEGQFQGTAGALRRTLDEIRRIRSNAGAEPTSRPVTAPMRDAIDPAPVNAILSMRGAVTDGVYRAAIGRVALVNGTPVGREMGMATTVSIFGSAEHAFIDADLIVGLDELQRVLMALRGKGLNITAIRNHIVGEHPQYIFVRIWGEGTSVNLATAFRYVLDVEVGAK